VLDSARRHLLLTEPVIVEEKLDGANVSIRMVNGWPECAGRRSGTLDRARQFGRLRSWAASHVTELRALLPADEVLFGEWLYLEHAIHYDALPDLLIVLDLWRGRHFVTADERDQRCARVALHCPPRLFRGVLGTEQALEMLHTRSTFGNEPAEGLVIRREVDGRLADRAKWVAPGFVQLGDDEWTGPRRFNALVAPDR